MWKNEILIIFQENTIFTTLYRNDVEQRGFHDSIGNSMAKLSWKDQRSTSLDCWENDEESTVRIIKFGHL